MNDPIRTVLDTITNKRPMLGAMLEQAEAVFLDGGDLVIRFAASERGVHRVFSTPANVATVEEIASRVLQRPVLLYSQVWATEVDAAEELASPWARLRALGFEMTP